MIQIAVLTGDIVNSTELSPARLDGVMQELENACKSIAGWAQIDTMIFSRASGDGWQVALAPACAALRVAVILRAQLLAAQVAEDTRISIASGEVDTPLPSDLNTASGAVFTASGRTLGGLAESIRMRYAGQNALDALTILIDARIQSWTANQAEMMSLIAKVPPPTQSQVAQALGKSKQTVSKSLKAAQADAILKALDLIESAKDD